ncbi:hypothetical protein OG272_43320 [Streptomyces sp. NBC_00104]
MDSPVLRAVADNVVEFVARGVATDPGSGGVLSAAYRPGTDGGCLLPDLTMRQLAPLFGVCLPLRAG